MRGESCALIQQRYLLSQMHLSAGRKKINLLPALIEPRSLFISGGCSAGLVPFMLRQREHLRVIFQQFSCLCKKLIFHAHPCCVPAINIVGNGQCDVSINQGQQTRILTNLYGKIRGDICFVKAQHRRLKSNWVCVSAAAWSDVAAGPRTISR